MANIFFSYTRTDREHVTPIAQRLKKAGWSVGWQEKSTQYRLPVADDIFQADCIVLAWSSTSVSDPWVRIAARLGAIRDNLVAIRLDEASLPFGIDGRAAHSLSNGSGRGASERWAAFQSRIEKSCPNPSMTPWRASEPTTSNTAVADLLSEYRRLLSKAPAASELAQLFEEVKTLHLALPHDDFKPVMQQLLIAHRIVRDNEPETPVAQPDEVSQQQLDDLRARLMQAPDRAGLKYLADDIRGLLQIDPDHAGLKTLRNHVKIAWDIVDKPESAKGGTHLEKSDTADTQATTTAGNSVDKKPSDSDASSIEKPQAPHANAEPSADSPTPEPREASPLDNLDSKATLEAVEAMAEEDAQDRDPDSTTYPLKPDTDELEQSGLLQDFEPPEYEPTQPKADATDADTIDSTDRLDHLKKVEHALDRESLNEPEEMEELDESEAISSLWELDSPEDLEGSSTKKQPPVQEEKDNSEPLSQLVDSQPTAPAEEVDAPLGPYHPSRRRAQEVFPTNFDTPEEPAVIRVAIKKWMTKGTAISLALIALPLLFVAYSKYFKPPVGPLAPNTEEVADSASKLDTNSPSTAEVLERALPEAPLPDMVNIPSGCATLGSFFLNEGPTRNVCLSEFRMSREEITFDLYDIFAEQTGRPWPRDEGWGRADLPVINVSWNDAKAYAEFVAERTAQDCRLPSEAEWEYAARGLTDTDRFWGKEANEACQFANVADLTAQRNNGDWLVHDCNDGYLNTAPVATFRPNAFGLYDMLGNVSEWLQDCGHDNFEGAPTDGQPWLEEKSGNCATRVTRGGSWRNPPFRVRSSSRGMLDVETKSSSVGFRVICRPSPET